MKIGNPPNYLIQVYPVYTDGDPVRATLYDGMYALTLNGALEITFVPAAASEQPWPVDQLPPEDSLTTADQMRWYQVITGICVVTPSATRTGEADVDGPVFLVTPAEFDVFTTELAGLEDLTDEGRRPRRDEALDLAVIRFIDEQVLESPLLDQTLKSIAGRGGQSR